MNKVLKVDLPAVAANNGQMRFVGDSLVDTDIENDGGDRFVLVRSNGINWVPVSRKELAEIRTFSLRLVGNSRYDVILNSNEDLTADRSLQINLGDTDAVLTIPKKYVALLSQADTDDPTAVVLENTLGGEVVWSRVDVGVYFGTLIGAFSASKVWAQICNGFAGPILGTRRTDDDTITVESGTDGQLFVASIEIRVYS